MWSRLPSLSADTDSLFAPTLNMQAQKASDSPRRKKRGTGAALSDRLRSLRPQVGTASPPKRNPSLPFTAQHTRWAIAQSAIRSPHPAPTPVILSEADHSIIVICAVEGSRRSQYNRKCSILSTAVLHFTRRMPTSEGRHKSGDPYLDCEVWTFVRKNELHRHELLPAVDVIGCACERGIGHEVYRKCGYISRLNHAPDRKRSS
jgi:hypothetical protein